MADSFRIDVAGIDCWVSFNPRLECPTGTPVEGAVVTGYTGERSIHLRDYPINQRVLLHEVLHRAIQTHEGEGEESLVRHLTMALWDMGWRWDREAATGGERDG
jgi:hypothetical protein